jgi:Ca-activated chloride channel family protein
VNFDEAQLQAIADATQGRYFNVRDTEGFQQALDEINRLETTRVERQVFQQFNERYAPWLILGAVLVLFSCLASLFLSRRPL